MPNDDDSDSKGELVVAPQPLNTVVIDTDFGGRPIYRDVNEATWADEDLPHSNSSKRVAGWGLKRHKTSAVYQPNTTNTPFQNTPWFSGGIVDGRVAVTQGGKAQPQDRGAFPSQVGSSKFKHEQGRNGWSVNQPTRVQYGVVQTSSSEENLYSVLDGHIHFIDIKDMGETFLLVKMRSTMFMNAIFRDRSEGELETIEQVTDRFKYIGYALRGGTNQAQSQDNLESAGSKIAATFAVGTCRQMKNIWGKAGAQQGIYLFVAIQWRYRGYEPHKRWSKRGCAEHSKSSGPDDREWGWEVVPKETTSMDVSDGDAYTCSEDLKAYRKAMTPKLEKAADAFFGGEADGDIQRRGGDGDEDDDPKWSWQRELKNSTVSKSTSFNAWYQHEKKKKAFMDKALATQSFLLKRKERKANAEALRARRAAGAAAGGAVAAAAPVANAANAYEAKYAAAAAAAAEEDVVLLDDAEFDESKCDTHEEFRLAFTESLLDILCAAHMKGGKMFYVGVVAEVNGSICPDRDEIRDLITLKHTTLRATASNTLAECNEGLGELPTLDVHLRVYLLGHQLNGM